jgi:hypothetical protein
MEEQEQEHNNLPSIIKLFNIFVKKKWTDHQLYESVLTNFSNLILNLSDHQRDLVLELADKYKWMNMNEISASLTRVMQSVEDKKLNTCKRIIVFPIMKPEDEEKIKSGHSVLYMIRGLKPFLAKYNHIEIIELLRYDQISEHNFSPGTGDIIFLVDDYLGSGETVDVTLLNVMANKNIKYEQLNIITIAAQNDTINHVKKMNIPIYYDFIGSKGISDTYSGESLDEKIKIMLEIEKMIPGSTLFSLGYNQSEALITLTRTPDNTFPIFWKDHRKKGKKFKAPFPRY